MAKEKKYRYTVTGTYPFPTDMLRYDAAHPTDDKSVMLIGMSRERYYEIRKETGLFTSFEAHLIGPMPTNDRWISFGWKVSNVSEIR
jgi:hypothetical protein